MIKASPRHTSPFLIVGWTPDGGETGARVINYLNKHLSTIEFAEIEPSGFFSISGVQVKDDLIQFPESKFYSSEEKDLLLFKSNLPSARPYKFLNLLLDIGQSFNMQQVYTIGGLVSMIPHTGKRRIITVANQAELKNDLADYPLETNLNYNGSPSISGFLLWVAKSRNIPAVSFWVDVPFYLADKIDPRGNKTILDFLNQRFNLGIDLKELDQEIEKQEEEITKARQQNPEINEYLSRLEKNMSLNQEEIEKLVQNIDRVLG